MKRLAGMTAAALLIMCAIAAGDDKSDAELRELRAQLDLQRGTAEMRLQEITMLKVLVTTLEARIVVLTDGVQQLKLICLKAGLEVPALPDVAAPAPRAVAVTYLGKPRSAAWLDEMFKEFSGKIAMVDGHFIDVGKGMLKPTPVDMNKVEPGTEYREVPPGFKVMNILAQGEAVIVKPTSKNVMVARYDGALLFHVKGLDTTKLIEGGDFSGKVVHCGVYHFVSPSGVKKEIPSYVVYVPLTREQFTQAIAAGFKLTRYWLTAKKEIGVAPVE